MLIVHIGQLSSDYCNNSTGKMFSLIDTVKLGDLRYLQGHEATLQ